MHETITEGGKPVHERVLNADFSVEDLRGALEGSLPGADMGVWRTLHADRRYEPYVVRQQAEIKRHREIEHKQLPEWIDYAALGSLRAEARNALSRFRPSTFGQASRLEGVTPSDLTLLSVLVQRAKDERKESGS